MLVTGATGFIGSRLAALALARGYSVKTLTRSDWSGSPSVPAELRYFGSLPDEIPEESLQAVRVVVHCAAIADPDEESASAVNVQGTMRLARLARESGVRTFIFLSSQSARPNALSAYGKSKYAAERALMDMDGLNVIILRPGLVTGTGNRGLFQNMSRMVETLPLVPLLGGGKSIVQPIHIDDLCEAIFRCDERALELQKRILHLGDPHGVSLGQFLQIIAEVRLGRRRVMVPIPLEPLASGLRLTENLGIRLPINSSNLKGLKLVEKMETEADLAELSLTLRPIDEMVRNGAVFTDREVFSEARTVRMLLIGAGRIGLVHALALSRLKGLVLSGIVDSKSGARAFLQRMGLRVRMFESLEEALAETTVDGVVIATPPATHLALARACVERGLAVMIEKPLAVHPEQFAEYEALAQEFPSVPMHVGYVMPRNPQVGTLLAELRSGRFGKVRGFVGVTLLSFIQESNPKRWEVDKSKSGGGVFINSGGHVLSMIQTAFGEPVSVDAQSVSLYSTGVEDSMLVKFEYPEFKGAHYCSWSIDGYPRQENKLIILTEQGHMILTGAAGVFVNNAGEVDITHQLDFEVGFNLAPDYAGAGFSSELNDLKDAILTGQRAPMDLSKALEIERLLFKAYENSRETKSFKDVGSSIAGLGSVPQKARLSRKGLIIDATPNNLQRVLDLRSLPAEDVYGYVSNAIGTSGWSELLLNPAQFAKVPAQLVDSRRLRVTVPDFLSQSRLLSTGRYGEVLKQMGVGGVAMALRAAVPMLIRKLTPDFWVAAMGLLTAGLHDLPHDFQGTLFLHTYLTDLALTLRRLDMLERMLTTCRRLRSRARLGFHTNMASEALRALQMMREPLDEVSVLTSPRALGISEVFAAMRQVDVTNKLRITAEVGLAPDIVHRVAFDAPECWAHGADAVLIGTGANTLLAEQNRKRFEQEWRKVFPGLSPPEGAL